MFGTVIRQTLLFILLVVLQVWLFNKIHLFGYITPLLSVYFIIKLPGDINRNTVLILAAFWGLTIDFFEYTLGVNMLACVITAFIRPYLLKMYVPRDLFDYYTPAFGTLGMAVFLRYAAVMTFIHHFFVFTIESFSFFDPVSLFFRIIGSTVLTILLIFACESINSGFRNQRPY
jgi:rod shape-determining protein MreD